MHSRLIAIFVACCLLLASIATATAQDATPATGGLADLGLPELDVTVTGERFEGIPEQLDAGRYLVSVTATEDTEQFGGGGLAFVQPVGATAEAFLAAVAPPANDATPMPEVPNVVYESTYAGGTYSYAGETVQFVVDLTPGEWIAWGDDAFAPWPPVIFEATGEMPTNLPEPESSATITMDEYSFAVSEGELVSGQQVIRIENTGAQPHHTSAGRTSEGVTEDDVLAVLEAEMTGTPASVDFNPEEDFQVVFFSGTQSSGTTMWMQVDLQPGPHILICFFMDVEDGVPHANHGMIDIVEVAG